MNNGNTFGEGTEAALSRCSVWDKFEKNTLYESAHSSIVKVSRWRMFGSNPHIPTKIIE